MPYLAWPTATSHAQANHHEVRQATGRQAIVPCVTFRAAISPRAPCNNKPCRLHCSRIPCSRRVTGEIGREARRSSARALSLSLSLRFDPIRSCLRRSRPLSILIGIAIQRSPSDLRLPPNCWSRTSWEMSRDGYTDPDCPYGPAPRDRYLTVRKVRCSPPLCVISCANQRRHSASMILKRGSDATAPSHPSTSSH
jgi:hypothetical protein